MLQHLEQDGVPSQLHRTCQVAQVVLHAGGGHKAAAGLLQRCIWAPLDPEVLKEHAGCCWGAVWRPHEGLQAAVQSVDAWARASGSSCQHAAQRNTAAAGKISGGGDRIVAAGGIEQMAG